MSLPGADELFRATGSGGRAPEHAAAAAAIDTAPEPPAPTTRRTGPRVVRTAPASDARRPSGRERHDEKITVYVSPEELVDLEQARLMLRAEHGLAVDRGRIVREALAVVLADFDAKGAESILARRLRDS